MCEEVEFKECFVEEEVKVKLYRFDEEEVFKVCFVELEE